MTFHPLKKYNRAIGSIFLLASFVFLAFVIIQNAKVLSEHFDANVSKQKYEQSQWQQSQNIAPIKAYDAWAISKGYDGWNSYADQNKDKVNIEKVKKNILASISGKKISDEELYSYTGYQLIHGYNPTLINPEVPPFGKYIIGLCIIIFQNEHAASLISAIVSLVLIFWIMMKLTHNYVASSLAVFLTSITTLFYDQILHSPQLDIFQLFFFLLTFVLYIHYNQTKKLLFLVLTGIVLGLFVSIKIAFVSYGLFNAWFIMYYLLKRHPIKQALKELIVLNCAACITYTITYFAYFLDGGSLRGFLGTQKWILAFYSNSHIDAFKLIGNYLVLIFTSKWRFWSTGYPYVSYEHWSILWPIIFALGIFSSVKLIKDSKKKNYANSVFLIAFLIAYNVFLFFVPIFPRYLLLLFVPFNMTISLYFATILRI